MRILLAAALLALPLPAAAEEHWAYLPPVAQVPDSQAAHPVDGFLDEARRAAGVEAAPLAEPRRWVERASFTLTGLPPGPEHLRRIERNPDEATWRAILDELLASPAYGERWARHWMDVARYADTSGYNFDQDNRYPFAYTYRDWLIRTFNEDMPYGEFVKLQIAADRLREEPDHPDLAALGFITTGPRAGGVETIDDRVDVVTRGFLASTVSCARCHEHKTDPITMEDYYTLHSIFENAREPEEKPVIGTPPDEQQHQAYLAEMAKLDEADRAVRQGLVDETRRRTADYLELAWLAKREDWDHAKATSEGAKRNRLRPKAILRWRDFLNGTAWKDDGPERLRQWADAADDEAGRRAACEALARELLESPELAALRERPECPLSYEADRISEFFDVEDGNQRRQRLSAVSRLQAEHPGSPPRAMSLLDKDDWQAARTFRRGNPAEPGEPFERRWLSFLGGGAFEDGKSPRLALAEMIADPANPLTARVMANRVWAWHFGAPLTEPSDFGPQQPDPHLLPLLDWLALEFTSTGGSLKQLHRTLLTSRAFRLASDGPAENDALDEANALFWKWNRRRADFEAMRDRLLATAGTLDVSTIGGRSISLDDPASDARRSVYAFVDRHALPSTFVSFDLPHPDHHAAGRVETTVPQQALYFLNGAMVARRAGQLAADPAFLGLPDDAARVRHLYQRIFRREATPAEVEHALGWIAAAEPADYQPRLSGHWVIRHAPDTGGPLGDLQTFPLFADGVWKTGPDPATAPIRWLNAGAKGGHAAANHALVLRWQSRGEGEVRLSGTIRRTQEGGATLEWAVAGPAGETPAGAPLPPESEATVNSGWVSIDAGGTLDFILRAPNGDACGGFSWDLRVEGRESPDGEASEIGNLGRDFPTNAESPAPPAAASPWADLIQMLWASNEFHYID